MSMEQMAGLALALVIMAIGMLGSILPGLPSTPIVLLAAVGHRMYFKETGPGTFVLILMLGVMLLSLAMDYLATMYGAKKLGATKRGIIGAVLGALVGLFFSLPGLILGPFIGAFAFEMAGGRETREAVRAGAGATLGLFAGALGKLACCVAMIGLFVINVLYRSLSGS
jgi:uncharacterized protein YqgC (DUF456 family)